MTNERLAISLTFLLLLLLSVFCATIDEACTVGKTLTPSSSFLSLGLKFAPGSPEKYLWKSSGLKCSEHTADWFCRLSMRSFRLDKINPFFTSFTGLGAIIAEERNYMESYTFFKVRNVVATKGNASSRHFTTPHASLFTENINKEQNESPCLTSQLTFDPGSSDSVTREIIAIFQLFQVSTKNRNSCGILLGKKWRFC